MTFALGGITQAVVRDQLEALLANAERLAIAVSYVQLSGWELLKPMITAAPEHVRILCTDQLGITDPKAVRRLMEEGFHVHAYCDSSVYHPKVFIATNAAGKEHFILGSANLSRSALITGVEATFGGHDETGSLIGWFDAMFDNPAKSTPFDEVRLVSLETSFAARLKSRLAYKRALPKTAATALIESIADEDAAEAAFASLDADPLPLNIDKAGSTVRTLRYVQELVSRVEPTNPKTATDIKVDSDMKQIGFMLHGLLTELGTRAREAGTLEGIAAEWSTWLKSAAEADLLRLNKTGKLVRARQIFDAFWAMPDTITTYFLENAESPAAKERPLLQTIELLANTRRRWSTLTLDDVATLSTMLRANQGLPDTAKNAVHKYLKNKGTRGWDDRDRHIILQAWRNAP